MIFLRRVRGGSRRVTVGQDGLSLGLDWSQDRVRLGQARDKFESGYGELRVSLVQVWSG